MTATEILLNAGYHSTDELLQGWALMVALSKLDQYRAECEFFAGKYQQSLGEFAQRVREQTGHEEFGEEDDLDDWNFALQALHWWKDKVEELRSETYPHHKHVGSQQNVFASYERSLEKVMAAISAKITAG